MKNETKSKISFSQFIYSRIKKSKASTFSKVVTRVAIGSIAFSLAVTIISKAVYSGFKEKIQEKIFSLSGHLTVTKFDLNTGIEESPIEFPEFLEKAQEKYGIAHMQSVAHKTGLLKSETEIVGAVFKGVSQKFDYERFSNNLLLGEPIKENSQEIIVSKKIADKLKVKVGDEPIFYILGKPIRARKLKIVGIYESALDEVDEHLIIGDLSFLKKINKWSETEVGSVEIFIEDFNRIEKIYQQLYKETPYDLILEKVTDKYKGYFDWFIILNKNVDVIIIILILVALFNIASVIVVLVVEKTKMIGTLKALGSTDWQIQQVFLRKAINIILKGVVVGNIFSLLVLVIQKNFNLIALDKELYYLSYIPINIDLKNVLYSNIMSCLTIVLLLIIILVILFRLKPIKSLKFA